MKTLLALICLLLLSGCLFKFSGTDNLYREGKKSKPTLTIDRIWCSQCGCEAIELKQMEKGNVVYELLLNCTDNCPPGVRSYKIERTYSGKVLQQSNYYWLVSEKNGTTPLTDRDTAMIGKVRQFRNELFFQHYCRKLLGDFGGCVQADSAKIIRP